MAEQESNNSILSKDDIKLVSGAFGVFFLISLPLTLLNEYGFPVAVLRSALSSLLIAAVVFAVKYFFSKYFLPETAGDDETEKGDISFEDLESEVGSEVSNSESGADFSEYSAGEAKSEKKKADKMEDLSYLHMSAVDDLEDDDLSEFENAEKSGKNADLKLDKNSNIGHNARDNDATSASQGAEDSIDSILTQPSSEGSEGGNPLKDFDYEEKQAPDTSPSLGSSGGGSGKMSRSADGSRLEYSGKDGKIVIPNDPEQIAKGIRTLVDKDKE